MTAQLLEVSPLRVSGTVFRLERDACVVNGHMKTTNEYAEPYPPPRFLSLSHPQLKRKEFMYVPFGFMGCKVNHTSLSPNLKQPFTHAASR